MELSKEAQALIQTLGKANEIRAVSRNCRKDLLSLQLVDQIKTIRARIKQFDRMTALTSLILLHQAIERPRLAKEPLPGHTDRLESAPDYQ